MTNTRTRISPNTLGAFLLLLLLIVLSTGARAARASDDMTKRLGGTDRYDTMGSIVREGFKKSTWAVVATGESFPDALAASALAGAHQAPIILTEGDELTLDATEQIKRLSVTHVYLLGGTAALSNKVERDLSALGVTVHRLAGADREATSVLAFKATREADESSSTVIIADGSSFADALSIGPFAWRTATPLLLSKKGKLSTEAIDAIKADKGIDSVLIVGGEAAVSDAVKSQLGTGYTYERLSGDDRYDTSVRVAEWETSHGLSWKTPVLASGRSFPDALSASALAGTLGSPLLLTSHNSSLALVTMGGHAKDISRCYVVGGTAAIGLPQQILLYWSLHLQATPARMAVDTWTGAWYGANGTMRGAYLTSPDESQAMAYLEDGQRIWIITGIRTVLPSGRIRIDDPLAHKAFEFQVSENASGTLTVWPIGKSGKPLTQSLTLSPDPDTSSVWETMADCLGISY